MDCLNFKELRLIENMQFPCTRGLKLQLTKVSQLQLTPVIYQKILRFQISVVWGEEQKYVHC